MNTGAFFGFKMGFLFYHIFVLFLCFYYIFDKDDKPNFYFLYYGHFIAFKHDFLKMKYVLVQKALFCSEAHTYCRLTL